MNAQMMNVTYTAAGQTFTVCITLDALISLMAAFSADPAKNAPITEIVQCGPNLPGFDPSAPAA